MRKIQYPMTTAAIFDDVVYPLHFENVGKVKQEIEGAVNWFCRWCNEERAVVRARLLVSCWGLYLNHEQVMQEAS
ncbi:protein ninY [Enterobacter cloacae]|uniref:protein ninY n=1 Tax=Enterobacter cloacae complex TaxID=354276 RepID=UPI003510B976